MPLEQTKMSLWCGDTDTRKEEEESIDESRQLSGKDLLQVGALLAALSAAPL